MAQPSHMSDRAEGRVRVYRWYYFIALAQLLLYFIVPIFLFPGRVIKDVQVISALTFGLAVGFFFLLVSILGLFLDRARRVVYIASVSVIAVYIALAVVAWSCIEQLDFLLR